VRCCKILDTVAIFTILLLFFVKKCALNLYPYSIHYTLVGNYLQVGRAMHSKGAWHRSCVVFCSEEKTRCGGVVVLSGARVARGVCKSMPRPRALGELIGIATATGRGSVSGVVWAALPAHARRPRSCQGGDATGPCGFGGRLTWPLRRAAPRLAARIRPVTVTVAPRRRRRASHWPRGVAGLLLALEFPACARSETKSDGRWRCSSLFSW
jgi:hypothetical protein